MGAGPVTSCGVVEIIAKTQRAEGGTGCQGEGRNRWAPRIKGW